jgi:hypothetical protein
MLKVGTNWRVPACGYVTNPLRQVPPPAVGGRIWFAGRIEGCVIVACPLQNNYSAGQWTVTAQSDSVRGRVATYRTKADALANGLLDAQDAIVTARIRALLKAQE